MLANVQSAAKHILSQAAECLGSTNPQAPPYKEGRMGTPRSS